MVIIVTLNNTVISLLTFTYFILNAFQFSFFSRTYTCKLHHTHCSLRRFLKPLSAIAILSLSRREEQAWWPSSWANWDEIGRMYLLQHHQVVATAVQCLRLLPPGGATTPVWVRVWTLYRLHEVSVIITSDRVFNSFTKSFVLRLTQSTLNSGEPTTAHRWRWSLVVLSISLHENICVEKLKNSGLTVM